MTVMRAQPHLKGWRFPQRLSPILTPHNGDNMAKKDVPGPFET